MTLFTETDKDPWGTKWLFKSKSKPKPKPIWLNVKVDEGESGRHQNAAAATRTPKTRQELDSKFRVQRIQEVMTYPSSYWWFDAITTETQTPKPKGVTVRGSSCTRSRVTSELEAVHEWMVSLWSRMKLESTVWQSSVGVEEAVNKYFYFLMTAWTPTKLKLSDKVIYWLWFIESQKVLRPIFISF